MAPFLYRIKILITIAIVKQAWGVVKCAMFFFRKAASNPHPLRLKPEAIVFLKNNLPSDEPIAITGADIIDFSLV